MNKIMALLFGVLLLSSFTYATRCLEDWDCDADEVCILDECFVPNQCTDLFDCGPTESCVNGACASMSCFVTSECPTDQMCSEGKCIPTECMNDSHCMDNQECMHYKCYDVQKEDTLSQPVNGATEEQAPSTVTSSTAAAACVSPVEGDCPVLSCPNKNCPEVTQAGLIENYAIPFLFVALILGLFIGYSASKIMSDNENGSSNEKKEERKSGGEESGETDFDDEGSYRYI